MISIGTAAFSGCDNLEKIVSLKEEPIVIYGKINNNNSVFSTKTFDNAMLYVPTGTKSKYEATYGWQDFKNIVEGIPSGIEATKTEANATVKARYTLDGKYMTKQQRGLNIFRMGDGTTKKVMVK